jgi:hypothetical protein
MKANPALMAAHTHIERSDLFSALEEALTIRVQTLGLPHR